jgi:Protein of unknown function (DUF4197)
MVIHRRSFLWTFSVGIVPAQTDRTSLGLKEALTIGLNTAVDLTGRLDGYFRNEAIKILMPDKLKPLVNGLSMIGMRGKVDQFVMTMNRAAEQAAPLARPIFANAIKTFNFNDARGLLAGGDTAITDFFKNKTKEPLAVAFRPPVVDAMGQTGATKQFNDLIGRYQKLPFANKDVVNIEDYVVGKALDGLFYMVAQEETKMRKNPAARVTSVLKEVFGRR